MKNIKESIQQAVHNHLEKIIADRRHIHQHPELSFEEQETSAFVASRLDEMGISYKKGIAIEGLETTEALDEVVVFQAGVKQERGDLYTAGGRVLNVTAMASTLPQAIEKAYEAVSRIQFEGAHYRTDIGEKALRHG